MNQLSTFSWSFEYDLEQYRRAGYQSVGVWRSKLSDFGNARGIKLIRELGFDVSCLTWAGGFTGCDGRTYEDSLYDAMDAIETAAELNASCVVLYTGSRANHTHNHARRLGHRAVEKLLPRAEELGVTLAVAPACWESGGEWSFLHTLGDVLQFIEEYPSPRLKFVFDTYHLGLSPVDLADVRDIATRIALVQVADARQPPRGEMNCCLLGDGTVPINGFVGAICDGGYQGYFDIRLLGEDLEATDYETLLEHSMEKMRQFEQLSGT